MICPKCKGEGQIIKKEKGTIGYIARLGICDKCHGSGEVEQTNEEWFCGLSTEEKARVLANEKLHFRMLDYDGFVEWLKKPHSEVGK